MAQLIARQHFFQIGNMGEIFIFIMKIFHKDAKFSNIQ